MHGWPPVTRLGMRLLCLSVTVLTGHNAQNPCRSVLSAMGMFQQLEKAVADLLVSNSLRGITKWHEPALSDSLSRLRCVSPHQRRLTLYFMAVAENGYRGLPCSALHTFRASQMDTWLASRKRATWLTNYLNWTSLIVWAMRSTLPKFLPVDASLIVESFQVQSWTKKANST